MNCKGFEKFITCVVCFETFDESSRCPRMLFCGHTFCNSCIEKILLQRPLCPTCKAQIQSQDAMLIPINFTAKAMIDEYKQVIPNEVENSTPQASGMNPIPVKLEAVGFCEVHSRIKEFRCMNCEYYICSVCGMLNHKHCRTLLIKEANEELKGQVSQRVEKELESRKLTNEGTSWALEYYEDERKNLEEGLKKKEISLRKCEKTIQEIQILKSEDMQFCKSLIQHRTAVENASDVTEFSKAMDEFDTLMVHGKKILSQLEAVGIIPSGPITIECIRKMCEIHPVFVVSNEDEILYGEVKVINDQIWISSFQAEKPKYPPFPFKELLSSEVPSMAFIKFTSAVGGNEEVDVVVDTDDPSSEMAKYFLNRCSALMKFGTFKGRILNQYNYPASSGCGFSTSCPITLDHLASYRGGIYHCEEEYNYYPTLPSGSVSVIMNPINEFYIAYKDNNLKTAEKFGSVISGLQKLKELQSSQIMIKETGLVI